MFNRILAIFTLMAAALAGTHSAIAADGNREIAFVSAAAAIDLFDDGAQFIDVRDEETSDQGQVRDAMNLPFASDYTEEALANLAQTDQTLVFYSGHRSLTDCIKAARLARTWGYKKVYVMQGGYRSWDQASLPTD